MKKLLLYKIEETKEPHKCFVCYKCDDIEPCQLHIAFGVAIPISCPLSLGSDVNWQEIIDDLNL